MHKLKVLITLLIMFFISPLLLAYDGIEFYGAKISMNDRYNSNGERLTTVRDILRQDRANYHRFNIRDDADQYDSYFSSKQNREIFDTARINISPGLARRILGNSPVYITVFVLTPNRIDVEAGLPTPGVD